MEITQTLLREMLSYNATTGHFVWLERPERHFSRRRFCLAWNSRYSGKRAGYIGSHGYEYISVMYVKHHSHRLAWLYVHGVWPQNEIDHINGIRTDNRLSNLREVTVSENARNKCITTRNTSGRVGVRWDKSNRKWEASICVHRKHIALGSYVEKNDAVRARELAEANYNFTGRATSKQIEEQP